MPTSQPRQRPPQYHALYSHGHIQTENVQLPNPDDSVATPTHTSAANTVPASVATNNIETPYNPSTDPASHLQTPGTNFANMMNVHDLPGPSVIMQPSAPSQHEDATLLSLSEAISNAMHTTIERI